MRLRCIVFVVFAFGCGRGQPLSPSDAVFVDAGNAPDGGATEDAGTPDAGRHDAGLGVECDVAADCAGPEPFSVRWCEDSSAFSCVDRKCAWECYVGGRTCDRSGDPCVRCGEVPRPICPDRPCTWPIDPGARIEEATCARVFHLDIDRCFGEWVELNDGTLCSIQPLPTGAPRYVLVCGRCQTTLLF